MQRAQKHDRCRPLGRLCRIWEIITREPKTPFGDPCVNFPGHVIRKPDPCIYSQFLLMRLQQPVTWDNPDVRILLNGVEQSTYDLSVGTTYTIQITVHNSSRDKPATGTAVYVRWIEFGAGSQTRHAIATLSADVPLWPGVAVVQTTWPTPDTPGHYCIEVELQHPSDGNPSNNLGWNNTQVHAGNSPVHRPIRIFNQYPNGCPPVKEGGGPYLRPHRVFAGWGVLGAVAGGFLYKLGPQGWDPLLRFLAVVGLGYAALAVVGLFSESVYAWIKRTRRRDVDQAVRDKRRTPCNLVQIEVDSYEFEDRIGKEFDPNAAFRGKPALWSARVEPAQFLFAMGEAYRDVELMVDAPDEQGPPGVFNVNVRQGGVPTGGATITITRGG